MTLLEIAKKFSDGFKEGWNNCQADGGAVREDEAFSLDDTFAEEQNGHNLFPEYDDIYDIGHETFHPSHPRYDKQGR